MIVYFNDPTLIQTKIKYKKNKVRITYYIQYNEWNFWSKTSIKKKALKTLTPAISGKGCEAGTTFYAHILLGLKGIIQKWCYQCKISVQVQ